MKTIKILLGFALATIIIYSCSNNESDNLSDNKSKVLYERNKIADNEEYTHYKNIQMIEKISSRNNGFKDVLTKTPSLELSLSNEILKYTYDGGIISYKIGDIYIYEYEGNVLPVKTTETIVSNKEKIITISSAVNNSTYYKMNFDTDKSVISSFENINHFPLEALGFTKDTDNILNKVSAVECDDLSWADCMDCSVEDCGRRWWCVALLVAAGPETLAGMAVSCTVNL